MTSLRTYAWEAISGGYSERNKSTVLNVYTWRILKASHYGQPFDYAKIVWARKSGNILNLHQSFEVSNYNFIPPEGYDFIWAYISTCGPKGHGFSAKKKNV